MVVCEYGEPKIRDFRYYLITGDRGHSWDWGEGV